MLHGSFDNDWVSKCIAWFVIEVYSKKLETETQNFHANSHPGLTTTQKTGKS